jgi:hypothetical protein
MAVVEVDSRAVHVVEDKDYGRLGVVPDSLDSRSEGGIRAEEDRANVLVEAGNLEADTPVAGHMAVVRPLNYVSALREA